MHTSTVLAVLALAAGASLALPATPAHASSCADVVRSAADEVATGQGLSSTRVRDLEATCGSDGPARVIEALTDLGYCADAAQLGRSLSGRTGVDNAVARADECLAEQVLASLDDLDATVAEVEEEQRAADPYGGLDEYWPEGDGGEISSSDANNEASGYGDVGTRGGAVREREPRAQAPASRPRASTPAPRVEGKRKYRKADRAATGTGRYEPSDDALAAATGSGPRIAAGADVAYSSLSFRVWFDFDSAALRPEALATIATLQEHLGTMGAGTILEVVGHTDSTGAAWYNDDLSVRRASSVERALILSGVDDGRVSIRGMGEYAPAYSNASEWGRARNRRVEFRFYRAVAARPVTR